MTEENQKEQPEVAKEETVQQPLEDNNTSQPSNDQQINWKKFREAREQERKQREEAERRAAQKEAEAKALKEAMEALLNKPSPRYESEDEYEDEDKIIQKKIDEALRKREEKEKQERLLRDQQELPKRLKENFNDFDKICTEENLDYLEYHYPEIAAAYKYMPDGVEKWGSIYKAIKKFIPNTSNLHEKSRIEKNLSKPQAMSSSGVTQVGDTAPIKIDEKRKAENWARMQKVMRGA